MIVVAVALVGASCGGGGKKQLDKEHYASALTKLCLLGSDQVRELHVDNTVAAWKHAGDELVKIEENFQKKFDALTPPDEIADAAREYRDANAKVLEDTRDAVSAAKDGDAAKLLAALQKSNTDNQDTWPPAQEIGATGCFPG